MKFSDAFEFKNKSGIKAGEGLEQGWYPFYTSSDELTKYLNEYLFEGDALIFGTGGNASVHFTDKKFAISTDCLVAQPIDKKKVHAKFYYYFLRGNMRILERGFKGAGLKHISKSYISAIELPKVDFDRQKMVVDILDQADALRQKRKQSLQLLDDFLRATFLDMFGDPVSNDKRWPVKKLGEVSFVKIGPFGSLLHREDYIANGTPLVNPTHIVNMKICPDFNFTISDKKREELRQYLLKEGDIVLARRGEIGRCGLITQKEDGYLCGTGSLFVRPQKDLNPIYLVYLISSQSMRKNLENSSVGVTMKNLNAGIVENTVIIHPDKKLQDKFEAVVLETNSLKNNMEKSIEHLDNQFNALTQRYFG